MRLHDKLNAAATAVRIELHWRIILRLRSAGRRSLERGETLNSDRLLRLNRRIDHHGSIVKRLERHYESQWVPPLSSASDRVASRSQRVQMKA